MKPKLQRIYNEASWVIDTKQVSAAVTQVGGMIAPVYFNRDRKPIQPYHIAPWCNEKAPKDMLPLLRALRGDFFCLPFGNNVTPYKKENHITHGEVANENWTCVGQSKTGRGVALHLRMKVRVRPGTRNGGCRDGSPGRGRCGSGAFLGLAQIIVAAQPQAHLEPQTLGRAQKGVRPAGPPVRLARFAHRLARCSAGQVAVPALVLDGRWVDELCCRLPPWR